MIFADLQATAGQASRRYGYVRDNVIRILTPGGGKRQQGYSVELAGAMLLEADDFFDRALMLFLLRTALRERQASTWGTVATYYSNYFAATAFVRLHLHAITHLIGGATYEVTPTAVFFTFAVSQSRRLTHHELWRRYYQLVTAMGWPSAAEVGLLAPVVAALQFKEQELRERVNYRPGEGFKEIHLSGRRYADHIQDVRRLDRNLPLAGPQRRGIQRPPRRGAPAPPCAAPPQA